MNRSWGEGEMNHSQGEKSFRKKKLDFESPRQNQDYSQYNVETDDLKITYGTKEEMSAQTMKEREEAAARLKYKQGDLVAEMENILENSKYCRRFDLKQSEGIQRMKDILKARYGDQMFIRLGRLFRRLDDDKGTPGTLTYDEFADIMDQCGLAGEAYFRNDENMQQVYADFDHDGNQQVSFDEFVFCLRPPMRQDHLEMILCVFHLLDSKGGHGVIDYEDLKAHIDVRKHPKYLNGEYTEKQCIEEYLKRFEGPGSMGVQMRGQACPDGKVTEEEFINYYYGVRASCPSDQYFDLMFRNAWKKLSITDENSREQSIFNWLEARKSKPRPKKSQPYDGQKYQSNRQPYDRNRFQNKC